MPEHGDEADAELAAAIEASYRAQTGAGMEGIEEEQLAQALELSRLEEEARQHGRAPPPPNVSVQARGGPPVATAYATDEELAAALAGDFDGVGEIDGMPPGRFDHGRGIPASEGLFGGAAVHGDDFASDFVVEPELSSEGPPSGATRGAVGDETVDPHLAMALEASYAAQTESGMQASEDDLIAQAIQISQREEEARKRQRLRDEQEQELQESMLMDQMRENQAKMQKEEDERLEVLEEARLEEEIQRKKAEEARKQNEEVAKRNRVPPEPPSDEPGRVDVMIRLPDGQRLRRAFRGSDLVGQVYDYLDISGGEALAAQNYRLVQNMPRRAYEERDQDLASAGLKGQCALLVEAIAS
eukprot:TRINITY_DN19320_c0_g1_i1.p1 TRINITY_DN19320_c0_g1~~TRINITY_DN19320_c0_g1_i1.p1  ORF type:complete len:358 (+),score=94.84 TRINITY_DN19320_c0_g1_i1:108-1181(+)